MQRSAVLFALLVFAGGLFAQQAPGKPVVGGRTSPDGKVEINCDVPKELLKKNIGSPPPRFNGDPRSLGCCVFRSLNYIGIWQNVPALFDMPEWMVQNNIEGGGCPTKVDQLIPKIAADRKQEVLYGQHTEGDERVLQALNDSGRGGGVTYNGSDPHYRGAIAHMVFLAHFDRKSNWAAIIDNNFPDVVMWMSCDEFLKRWRGTGGGWVVFLLNPPPPPPPRNWQVPP